MNFTTRKIALLLTAATLFSTNIVLNVKDDRGMVVIFGMITLGFLICTIVAWIEYRQDKKLGEITK